LRLLLTTSPLTSPLPSRVPRSAFEHDREAGGSGPTHNNTCGARLRTGRRRGRITRHSRDGRALPGRWRPAAGPPLKPRPSGGAHGRPATWIARSAPGTRARPCASRLPDRFRTLLQEPAPSRRDGRRACAAPVNASPWCLVVIRTPGKRGTEDTRRTYARARSEGASCAESHTNRRRGPDRKWRSRNHGDDKGTRGQFSGSWPACR